jgi:hypothetical protein
MLGYLQPVDALEQVFDSGARLVQQGTLFKQSRDDALDERDLRVFKPLKPPAVEFQAEDIIGVRKAGLDHFEDTGLAHAPVPVHADRDGLGSLITKQRDDGCRDRFVVEQVYACFIVGKDHHRPSTQSARQMRAGEIASLTWDMVVDASGQIGNVIELRDHAAKKGSGRLIPMHPELAGALSAWRQTSTGIGAVIRSERGGAMTPLSVVVWFNRAFRNIGLSGCSSHSGRRTFITRAARLVHRAGGSLRDVQLLAGHRSIHTTERYIDGDTDAQRKLVSLI